MNLLELVVTERNRLVRYSIILSVVSTVLAIWARDPFLSISTPFSGDDVGNITVAHAVLIGHPVVCVLFLAFTAQILRYKALVVQLPRSQVEHLDWRYCVSAEERGMRKTVRVVAEFFKWFAMVAVPAVASLFLLVSQFDFRDRCTGEYITYSRMFDGSYFGESVSYKSVHIGERCSKPSHSVGSDEKRIEKILDRMPTLYQPANFLGGLLLEIAVVCSLVCMFLRYFGKEGASTIQGAQDHN